MDQGLFPDSTIVWFRDAVAGDVEGLRELYAQLVPDEDPDPADMEKTLEALRADPEAGSVVVGTLDGQLVATCQVVRYPNLVRAPRFKAYIDSVVVRDGYRHLGIGTRMIRWVVEELERAGCSRAMVQAAWNRTEGHGLYLKVGFEKAGYGFVYDFG